eukprot:3876908-Pleurochrysis_carterae.AAC.1
MEERAKPPQDAQAAGDQSAGLKNFAATGAAGTGTATTVRAKPLSQTQSRNQLCSDPQPVSLISFCLRIHLHTHSRRRSVVVTTALVLQ